MTYLHRSGRDSQSGGSGVLFSSPSSSSPPQAATSSASASGASSCTLTNNLRSIGAWCAPVLAVSILPVGDAAAQDRWTSPDKALHLGGSALIAGIGAHLSDSNAKVLGVCAGIGAGKEMASWAFDRNNKPSGKDMAANLLGCSLGLAGTRWSLRQAEGRTELRFTVELP